MKRYTKIIEYRGHRFSIEVTLDDFYYKCKQYHKIEISDDQGKFMGTEWTESEKLVVAISEDIRAMIAWTDLVSGDTRTKDNVLLESLGFGGSLV